MTKIKDIYDFLDKIAPFSAQESWDNSGFLLGDGEKEVTKILTALDVTKEVLNEASEKGAELIISHHPIIFSALKELHPSSIAFIAVEKGIAVISSHTSLDIADDGVNDCFAKAIGLKNIKKCGDEIGLLRIGELDKEMTCSEFVKYIADRLSVKGIKYVSTKKMIKKVAVCGGSGAEFFKDAMSAGADAYVTSNIKHNLLVDIKKENFCVLDAGHFCTENTVIKPLSEKIKKAFPNVDVIVAESACDPAEYFVKY